jgi:hypothetical protein
MDSQIYYLNKDPVLCAREHCDEHVKTQCFDIGMLLSYMYRCHRDDEDVCKVLYSPNMNTNVAHYYWIREAKTNYKWLYSLWEELFKEHLLRFNKSHISFPLLALLKDFNPGVKYGIHVNTKAFSTPPCHNVPAKYQQDNNRKPCGLDINRSALNSYRNWYINEFAQEDKYTNRELPKWAIKTVALTVPTPLTTTYGIPTPAPRPRMAGYVRAGVETQRAAYNLAPQMLPGTFRDARAEDERMLYELLNGVPTP